MPQPGLSPKPRGLGDPFPPHCSILHPPVSQVNILWNQNGWCIYGSISSRCREQARHAYDIDGTQTHQDIDVDGSPTRFEPSPRAGMQYREDRARRAGLESNSRVCSVGNRLAFHNDCDGLMKDSVGHPDQDDLPSSPNPNVPDQINDPHVGVAPRAVPPISEGDSEEQGSIPYVCCAGEGKSAVWKARRLAEMRGES